MSARLTSRAAELALSNCGTRGPDESPDCPGGCGGDADHHHPHGLCANCGADERAKVEADDEADERELDALCDAARDAWIEAHDATWSLGVAA